MVKRIVQANILLKSNPDEHYINDILNFAKRFQ